MSSRRENPRLEWGVSGGGWKLRVLPVLLLAAISLTASVSLAAKTQDAELLKARARLDDPRRQGDFTQDWMKLYAATFDKLDGYDFEAYRRAIHDIIRTFGEEYPKGEACLERAAAFERRRPELLLALTRQDSSALDEVEAFFAFQREALLRNPLLNFDKLRGVRRKPLGDPRRWDDPNRGLGEFLGLPRQSSWQMHSIPRVTGWDNEIAVLSSIRGDAELTTLFKPATRKLVSDVDLHWDADRLMFSMPDDNQLWQLWEVGGDGQGLRQITPGDQPEVHSYDSVYLPGGKINFISNAALQGVPCNTGLTTGMMYQVDADGKNMRQLAFDQDHNYNPTVMNDGRVLYLRWEYTDVPHVWARYLFTMNPDGTDQKAYYGSGGYWPNAMFYSRPIPGHPSKIASVITGHHIGRTGDLIIFDPSKGRTEAEGVVQQIPGYGKEVRPLIEDKLTMNSYPKFLHPYPLSENYYLVASKPTRDDLWGIYLVDVFDNMTLIKEVEGQALLEPIPFRKTQKPPVIPERVDLKRDDGLVLITDIYDGPGLAGVPRGAVKNLRLYTYHFAYQEIAGIDRRVGTDGPWEPKQVLGVVPVEKDGSALFRVPARTPISIQPLDERGRAVQLMRSWLTAQPGEFVSCNGCHESQSTAAANRNTLAMKRAPSEIEPWRGPIRGFSFKREVQPVLDAYCVSCHNGSQQSHGEKVADLRADQGKMIAYRGGVPVAEVIDTPVTEMTFKKYGGVFDPSYVELRKYVRVGGLESDLRMLNPGEFHANTTELVQMLEKGHHGVSLSREAWDRLYTWIDLNAPAHGTWREAAGEGRTEPDYQRRRELRELYAGFQREDEETILNVSLGDAAKPNRSSLFQKVVNTVTAGAWPFDAAEARRRQVAAGGITRTIDLGDGVGLEMVLIPAGEFVMGDPNGAPDELPLTAVKLDRPYWIGKVEVTNEQYAEFDPTHESRFEHKGSWWFNRWDRGWPLNSPQQPVVRVSQTEALAFCRWLSERSGAKVTLPTEAQWEYACRAGTDTRLSFGDTDTDFSTHANLADWTIRDLVYDVRNQYPPDIAPRDGRFNDGALVTSDVGQFKPNPWGLHDMHGNAWEWTRSAYRSYPYSELDGRNDPGDSDTVVARGGSWYDRPLRSRSSYRLNYPAWQKVHNVGLRVVIEADGDLKLATRDD
jgi:formylglycine-generating enzyme required for sulfatase activity